MPLSDAAVRNAKPKDKPYKLGDSGGLFLSVQPTGTKAWRVKYRVHGKEKKLSLGKYPEIGLAKARELRDEAKGELAIGKDPAREKQRRKIQAVEDANNTFSLVASEYCQKRTKDGDRAWADLPPFEWSKIDDILDYEGGKECRARSIARKRLSASCVKRRLCWRMVPRRRRRVGGSRSASRPAIGGARNMAV